MIGPPNVKIFSIMASFDIHDLYSIYLNADSMFRMPDTYLRLTLFTISMLLLFLVPNFKIKEELCFKFKDNHILIIIFLFFIFYLSSQHIYNILGLVLIISSMYYYVFSFEYDLRKSEALFLSSYVLIFLYPFYQSLFIPSTLSEVDNYLRFLFAIPLYLLIRTININKTQLLYSVNFISFAVGIIALFFLITHGDIRLRGFTSTSAIFANISLLLFILSVSTIKTFYSDFNKHMYLPVLASLSALSAWSLTGSRGSLIMIIFLSIIILFNKHYQKIFIPDRKSFGLFAIFLFSIFLYQSDSMTRIHNAYNSTYNYITESSGHSWTHKDSIIPRLSIWSASINMIQDNPGLGVGLNNYNQALNDEIVKGNIPPIRNDRSNYTAGMNHAHNQYLDIFSKTGIIGFLTLIYFIAMNFYYFYHRFAINRDNIPSLMGLLVLISYSSYMMYHTILSHQQSVLFMTFTLSIFAGLSFSYSRGTVKDKS